MNDRMGLQRTLHNINHSHSTLLIPFCLFQAGPVSRNISGKNTSVTSNGASCR